MEGKERFENDPESTSVDSRENKLLYTVDEVPPWYATILLASQVRNKHNKLSVHAITNNHSFT